MDFILLAALGGLTWTVIWILYVLLQTIIYGALTCATGLSAGAIGTCITSPEMFQIVDVSITPSGVVAFLLLVATLKFFSQFWTEAGDAFPRILSPFGVKA